jgi:hypothetical protein
MLLSTRTMHRTNDPETTHHAPKLVFLNFKILNIWPLGRRPFLYITRRTQLSSQLQYIIESRFAHTFMSLTCISLRAALKSSFSKELFFLPKETESGYFLKNNLEFFKYQWARLTTAKATKRKSFEFSYCKLVNREFGSRGPPCETL